MPFFDNTHILGDITITGILKSLVSTGTAPFVIASTTAVTNLNADLLDGQHGSYYAVASSIGNATITLAAGNGLVTGGSFTTNQSGNATITFDMGTPGTLTDATTSAVTADSHTHAITNYAISGTANQITVSDSPKVLGSATTLSLPQNIHTTATPTFGRLTLTQAMTAGTTAAFTNPHLILASTDVIDNTGFVGMTFATSTSANYGYSLGALRTTNGGGNLVIRNHFSDAAGVEAFRLSATGTITLPTSGTLTTSTGPLFLSTSAGNGDITINPNGSGRLIHTKALASKGATYTHTWMQFDEDTYGNSLLLGSGGLTVIGGGESVTQIRGNIPTASELLVFGSDESTTSTAFRFIASLQNGWATRTEVFNITGAGNATLLGNLSLANINASGDIAVNGGDITSTSTTFNFLTTNVTTLNIGSAGTHVIIPGNLTVSGLMKTNNVEVVETSNGILFEGSVADDYETLLKAINPTADRTIELPNASGTVALVEDLHSRSHTMTETSDHTSGNWKVFHSNGSGQVIELNLGGANTYLKANGATSAPTFSQIAYSDISNPPTIPTVNDGTLSWTTNTAGATNTTVSGNLSGAYSANTPNNRTLNLIVGPSLTNLATTMTGASLGYLRKSAADTYVLDNMQFLRKDTSDTLTGDLTITGTLYATAKSFLINHPTKKDMKLRYGSLEGPENGIYIRGKIKKSKKDHFDYFVIELPDYWSSLVDEKTVTVNLTPIGGFQKLYVERIEGNKVYISNSNDFFHKDIDCYYTVYGERKDIKSLEVEIPS